jgi:hypothetical protein
MHTDLIEVIAAHKHCIRHREEIVTSKVWGCFYCLAVFPLSEIKKWVDKNDGIGQTALCPEFGVDAVIGSNFGYSIERAFLGRMQEYWF